MKVLVLLVVVGVFSINALMAQIYPNQYICYFTNSPIKIDGELSLDEWGDALWSEDFIDIEGVKKPYHRTHVKMLWDSTYLYVGAELFDDHVWATLIERDDVIYHDNDFEVFIDPDGDRQFYYELEVNAFNTVWDLLLVKTYRDGGPAITSWDIKGLKSNVKINGTINNPSDEDQCWTVEIAFPWKAFSECNRSQVPPKGGDKWRVNFSRVQWRTENMGSRYQKLVDSDTGKPLSEDNWTWTPQYEINMHAPEHWGYVQFSSTIVGQGYDEITLDPDYHIKMKLMELYKFQKEHLRNNGNYSLSIPNGGVDAEVSIEIGARSFLLRIHSSETNKVWIINQNGRLWSE